MSKLQAIAFFEEISKNKQLAHEVEKVVVGKNSDEAKAKELLSLAKKHNFNFTQEEAASVQGALKTSLSPEEMLEVSGGKIGIKSSLMTAAMLLVGLGVGGTTLYSMNTSADGPEGNKQKQMEIIPLNQGDDSDTETISREEVVEPKQKETTLTTLAPKRSNAKKFSQEIAKRYPKELRFTKELISNIRAQAFRAALPSASWPKIENPSSTPGVSNCRHCGSPLYIHSTKKHTECRCTDDGCIDNWCFRKMANEQGSKNSQRGDRANDFIAHCRCSLLPAVILDSRLPTASFSGQKQRSANTPLACGAEYWATAQLIIGYVQGWRLSPQLTLNTSEENIRQVNEVKRLLEKAYDKLTKEEMMQIIDGHNSNWANLKKEFKTDILCAEYLKKQNKQKGKLPKEVPEKTDQEIQATVDRLVALLEEAYKCITDDKLNSVGIDPGIAPDRIPSMLPLHDTTTAMDEETFEPPLSTRPLMQQTNSLNDRQSPPTQASFGSTNQNMSHSPQMMNQMQPQQQMTKPKAILKQQMPHHQPEIPQPPKNFLNTNSMLNNNNMMNQMQPQQQMTKLSNLNHMMNQMQPQQQNPITAMEPRERQEYIRRSIVEDVKQYFSKPNPIADLDEEYKQNPKKVAIALEAAVNELINLPADDYHKEMLAVWQDQNGKISPYHAYLLYREFEEDIMSLSSWGRLRELEHRLFYGPRPVFSSLSNWRLLAGCVGRAQHLAVMSALNDVKKQLFEHMDSDEEKQKFEAEITKRINEIDERFNTILSGQGKLNLSGDPEHDDILLHYNNEKTYKPTIDTPENFPLPNHHK